MRIHDSSTGRLTTLQPGPVARVYVCGITPYDATHLGHAATYVTFDLLIRALRDAGHRVHYVQNVTDVDDPLLERAARDGVDWTSLAQEQIALFRADMTALAVIAPDDYVGVVESAALIAADVAALLREGTAYQLTDGAATDVYFDLATQARFGEVSRWTRAQMMAVYADRGGDPDRQGKRDRLDPLLWRGARPGEPSFPSGELRPGRPGWHVECTSIALDRLGPGFDVQGGGIDLIFPHHEMSAVQAVALTSKPFARAYVHQEMVGLHGEKMSKSRGNLVLVSRLRQDGVHPMAIRLALLAQHYRTPWDWTDDLLAAAQSRLATWHEALSVNAGPSAEATVGAIRERLADDLDAPGAVAAVDSWAADCLAHGGSDIAAPGLVGRALDALLGIRL